ncbi:MAG: autotransporter domain-containing protein [Puniceicoccales bacterium]|jgi:uncharacterized protein with beta-barrel porin domain|nr:autotransporter domain-containing protein [Puniceicoccales bacterium]
MKTSPSLPLTRRAKAKALLAAAATLASAGAASAATNVIYDVDSTLTAFDGHSDYAIRYNTSDANNGGNPVHLIIDTKEAVTTYSRWLSAASPDVILPFRTIYTEPDKLGVISIVGKSYIEYRGWRSELAGNFFSTVFNSTDHPLPSIITDTTTLNREATRTQSNENYTYGAFSGTVEIKDDAVLRVSGYLNQWVWASGLNYENEPSVVGVQRYVLSDAAAISFQNTPANLPQDAIVDAYQVPNSNLRYNIAKNIESRGNNTELQTGLDDTYRIVVHIDETYDGTPDGANGTFNEGGIGFLRGSGWFVKTGMGTFKVKNDGDFEGVVILNGGVSKLASAGGGALKTAQTVTLAGPQATQGTYQGNALPGGVDLYEVYMPPTLTYAEVSPAGRSDAAAMVLGSVDQTAASGVSYTNYATVLVVETNQTIRNFQNYCNFAGSPDELFASIGTGSGTAVYLSTLDYLGTGMIVDSTLTVNQEQGHDGHYTGDIIGETGSVFRKIGTGSLFFTGNSDPENFKGLLDVQEGHVGSNVQSLGKGTVNIGNAGSLTIVQNNSGTLLATLTGDTGGLLLVTTNDSGANQFGNLAVGSPDLAGVMQMSVAQPNFYGSFVVANGVTVLLAARDGDPRAPNDALINASSVTLRQGLMGGGAANRETTLSFADTDQRLNNFSGDTLTRLDLGRGTVTLRQYNPTIYAGRITGVGSVIVLTSTQMTLAEWNTYFGATILKPLAAPTAEQPNPTATLVLGNSLDYPNGQTPGQTLTGTAKNSSGLILYKGASVLSLALDTQGNILENVTEDGVVSHTYLPQKFGALFGEQGSKITMGDATLTLGTDTSHTLALSQELLSAPNRVPTAQAAYFFNTTRTGDEVRLAANPEMSDFSKGASIYYLKETLGKMAGVDADSGRGLSNADALSYAGEIIGSGIIEKVGDQRISFSGTSPDFTGTVNVAEGVLRMRPDSFPVAREINVSNYHGKVFDANWALVDAPPEGRPALIEFRVGSTIVPQETQDPADTTKDSYLGTAADPFPLLLTPIRGNPDPTKAGDDGNIAKVGQGPMRIPYAFFINTVTGERTIWDGRSASLPAGKAAADAVPSYSFTGTTYVKEGALYMPVHQNLGNFVLGNIVYSDTDPLDYFGGGQYVFATSPGTVVFEIPDTAGDVVFYSSITDRYSEHSDSQGAYGNVGKDGAGKLTLYGELDPSQTGGNVAHRLDYSGTTTVLAGELIFAGKALTADGKTRANVPSNISSYSVAAGAVLTFDIPIDVQTVAAIGGNLVGAGDISKAGPGLLAVTHAQEDFTGSIYVKAGELSIEVKNAFAQSNVLEISQNATVRLNGYSQIFSNLSGEPGSKLIADEADLTFKTAAGQVKTYQGTISGNGKINKAGPGTLILRGSNEGDFVGAFVVSEGVLDATIYALSDRPIDVQSKGTLRIFSDNDLRTDDPNANPEVFSERIDGVGKVIKYGTGTVKLAWDASQPTDALKNEVIVEQGRLIVDTARNDNLLPRVDVWAGAQLQVNLQASEILYSNLVVGGGDLIVDGQQREFGLANDVRNSLVFNTVPDHKGVTYLQNGAILDVGPINELPGGIASDSTSALSFGVQRDAFYITQSKDSSFSGSFIGKADIYIKGDGILRYKGSDGAGNLGVSGASEGFEGTITLEGGSIEVGIANTKAIRFQDSKDGKVSTLYINVRDTEEAKSYYRGPLYGVENTAATSAENRYYSGNIVKTGTATLNTDRLQFLSGGDFIVRVLGVESGILRVTDYSHLARVESLQSYGDGRIVLAVPYEAAQAAQPTLVENLLRGDIPVLKEDVSSLTLENQPNYSGTYTVAAGAIQGSFTLGNRAAGNSANLIFQSGAALAPGTSASNIGTVTVAGNLDLQRDSVLKIEIGKDAGANFIWDKVLYGGSASLNGRIEINLRQDGAGGSAIPARGQKYVFLERLNPNDSLNSDVQIGEDTYLVSDDVAKANNLNYILVAGDFAKGTAYEKAIREEILAQNPNAAATIFVTQWELAKVPGYTPHKGLGSFIRNLDFIATDIPYGDFEKPDNSGVNQDYATRQKYLADVAEWQAQKAVYELGAHLNTAVAKDLTAIVNNLSPLGYGSLAAMPAAAASATIDQLHGRIEQRRYDNTQFAASQDLFPNRSWQFYLAGLGSYADLGSGTKDSTFKYQTFGGIVGADVQLSPRALFGVVADYTNGSATLHDNGGKIKMDEARGGAYFSYFFTEWFFVDAGVNAGWLSYDARRNTVPTTLTSLDAAKRIVEGAQSGANRASPEGWTAGGFLSFGTAFALMNHPVWQKLNLNPYINFEYNHYGFDAFTETGSASRLKVYGYDFDSFRTKVGTGIMWLADGNGRGFWGNMDSSLRLNLDISFTSEILDGDSEISSRFEVLGTGKTKVSAKSLPDELIQIAPSITYTFDASKSVFLGYRYETSFAGAVYHNFNVGFRWRF